MDELPALPLEKLLNSTVHCEQVVQWYNKYILSLKTPDDRREKYLYGKKNGSRYVAPLIKEPKKLIRVTSLIKHIHAKDGAGELHTKFDIPSGPEHIKGIAVRFYVFTILKIDQHVRDHFIKHSSPRIRYYLEGLEGRYNDAIYGVFVSAPTINKYRDTQYADGKSKRGAKNNLRIPQPKETQTKTTSENQIIQAAKTPLLFVASELVELELARETTLDTLYAHGTDSDLSGVGDIVPPAPPPPAF